MSLPPNAPLPASEVVIPPHAEALASRFATRIHRLAVATTPPRTIDLLAPVDPDALLDDPVVEQRYKADNYLPYWPIIWPSGLMLATKILSDTSTPPPPARAAATAVFVPFNSSLSQSH